MSASINDATQDIASNAPKPSICAACGEEFSCAANSTCGATPSGCWCFEIKLSDSARKELEGRYQGCLCNKCLATFSCDRAG